MGKKEQQLCKVVEIVARWITIKSAEESAGEQLESPVGEKSKSIQKSHYIVAGFFNWRAAGEYSLRSALDSAWSASRESAWR